MKLRKGKTSYKLPPYGEVLSVHASHEKGTLNVLCAVRDISSDITREGDPRFFIVLDDHLYIAPIPKRGGELIVKYYPPVREA